MRMEINCSHQVKTDSVNLFICKIGMYGGHPYIGNCLECVNKNQNNEEYAKELFAKSERTHPSNRARISGCCDSAINYIE